jgi:hypothetical protein
MKKDVGSTYLLKKVKKIRKYEFSGRTGCDEEVFATK